MVDPGWPAVVGRIQAPTLDTAHLVHAVAPEEILELVTAFLDA